MHIAQLAADDATVLLAPSNVNHGFNSELFDINHRNKNFKLIETGNITRIHGKYVMAYSRGCDFQQGQSRAKDRPQRGALQMLR